MSMYDLDGVKLIFERFKGLGERWLALTGDLFADYVWVLCCRAATAARDS